MPLFIVYLFSRVADKLARLRVPLRENPDTASEAEAYSWLWKLCIRSMGAPQLPQHTYAHPSKDIAAGRLNHSCDISNSTIPFYAVIFLLSLLHLSFSNCVMSNYTFKLYAMDWVYSGRVFSCFSQYTTSRGFFCFVLFCFHIYIQSGVHTGCFILKTNQPPALWFSNLFLKSKNSLNQIVRLASRLIGEPQLNPESLHTPDILLWQPSSIRIVLTLNSIQTPLHSGPKQS